ncbi:hypothetical protein [Nonomuraea sp. SYSU D8015]|uniref:hypothetical protein n=1 Tax=Nonomuraea sp. SYSU D8015 TaxID=2593644 RepID=UPI0016607E65|nr:hypothetical protein [Nonomuraea sp. SYSU D8015]
MPDARGLHDLRVLFRQPGVDVPDVRLAWDAPAELDEQAKAGYQDRLARLQEEITRSSMWATMNEPPDLTGIAGGSSRSWRNACAGPVTQPNAPARRSPAASALLTWQDQ